MKALISLNEKVSYISSWEYTQTNDGKGMEYRPITSIAGARVVQLSDQEFDISAQMFWKEYNGTNESHRLYYDVSSDSILDIVDANPPIEMTEEKQNNGVKPT